VGRFDETTLSDSGDRLIGIRKQHDLKICNIFFEHKNIYIYIYMGKIFAGPENLFKVQAVRVKRVLNCASERKEEKDEMVDI